MPLPKKKRYLFALFVGRSGSGKSAAAASWLTDKSEKKFLEMDFDLRGEGILDYADTGIIDSSRIEIKEFLPQGGWIPIQTYLELLKSQTITGMFPYETMGVGSLTGMTRIYIILSHTLQESRTIGGLRLSGPADYNFEANATHQTFDYLRGFPCNLICTAHIVDKWGKSTGAGDYAPASVIGEKLSIRDNLGENVQTYFNNVWRFSKDIINGELKFFVEFSTSLAKNTYGLPPGKFDITNKNFKKEFENLVKLNKEGKLEVDKSATEFSMF